LNIIVGRRVNSGVELNRFRGGFCYALTRLDSFIVGPYAASL
jgi:hypothetical protein